MRRLLILIGLSGLLISCGGGGGSILAGPQSAEESRLMPLFFVVQMQADNVTGTSTRSITLGVKTS
jgi:hypothetical protein